MKPLTNGVDLWLEHFPFPSDTLHKYDRGHLAVIASEDLTGATRLAASAANRIGAGVVTVLSRSRVEFYQTCLPPDIIVRSEDHAPWSDYTVCLGGPGGILDDQRNRLVQDLSGHPRLLDAGALPTIAENFNLDSEALLTPHEGEFARVFPDLTGSRQTRLQRAVELTNACILLKGPQTLICHPDGRHVINDRPNPYLAKAGSGDVLAGFISGLMAQGMETFHAACAGAWMLSECADRLGPGLTGSDLEMTVTEVLWELQS